MTLNNILNGLEYSFIKGNIDVEISDIIYDSRKVTSGCVFVCLKGATVDGHNFAKEAIKKGAVAVVYEEELDLDNVTCIKVENTRAALASMSASFFNHPANEIITIGITGTKGKTTTTCMVKSILEKEGYKAGVIGTIGIIIGDEIIKTNNTTPESYEIQKYMRLMIDKGCKVVVMEASSLGLKWNRLDAFTFDYGVFMNLSPDHIGTDEHETFEEYVKCKSLLFKKCKLGIVNIDDKDYANVIENHTCDIETFGFSDNADIVIYNRKLISRPGYLGVHFDIKGKYNLAVDAGTPGKFSAYNATAAIAICKHLNVSDESIKEGLKNFKVSGRVEIIDVPGNYTLIIDYAHNEISMENILKTLKEYNPKRLITLFGSGGDRSKQRRFDMGEVSGKLSDLSVLTDDNPRFENVMDILNDIEVGVKRSNGKYIKIPDRAEAIKYCMNNAQDGDIIVLAGKGHEDYQIVGDKKIHFSEREVIEEIISKHGTVNN